VDNVRRHAPLPPLIDTHFTPETDPWLASSEGQRCPQRRIKVFKTGRGLSGQAAAKLVSVTANQRVRRPCAMPTGNRRREAVTSAASWIAPPSIAAARPEWPAATAALIRWAKRADVQLEPQDVGPAGCWPIPAASPSVRWRSQSLIHPDRRAPWNMPSCLRLT